MSADTIKSTFFNVIMKSPDNKNAKLGLHLTTGTPQSTTIIASVDPGSISEACGLRPGDVVDMVNGKKVGSMSVQEVESIIERHKERVQLQIRRNNATKNKSSFKEENEEASAGSLASLSKSVSTECQSRRKKSKEGSCGSFMHRLFRSRSQDNAKQRNSNHYGSTARSSSLIVHLSRNILSSSENTIKRTNKLSSCMKIFKSKNAEQEPEIDVSVLSPNNAFTKTTSKDSESLQEISESSTSAASASLPISLNVVNSQVSPAVAPTSSSKTIVNISPTLEIINISTMDEQTQSTTADHGILNYTGALSTPTTSDAPSAQVINSQNSDRSKSSLPPLHSRVENVLTINSSVNANSKDSSESKVHIERKFTPVTASCYPLYKPPQNTDYRNCWTASSSATTKQSDQHSTDFSVDVYSQKVNEQLKCLPDDVLTITEESLKTTESIENHKVEKELQIEDSSAIDAKTKKFYITQNLSTRSIETHDDKEPLAPPKRSAKKCITPESDARFTKNRMGTGISSKSNVETNSLVLDKGITTTSVYDSVNSDKLKDCTLEKRKNSEKEAKIGLDRILDDALLELNADTNLCKPRPEASNQQSTELLAENNAKTRHDACSNDVPKHDSSQFMNYASSTASVLDNNTKRTHISKAEILQKDYTSVHKKLVNNDSLVLYSINSDTSDVGQSVRSPDSGISSISSPYQLNLQPSNLIGYKFNEAQADNFMNNKTFSCEETSASYDNSAIETGKSEKKLVNVVSPTKEEVKEIPYEHFEVLKRPCKDLIESYHGFEAMNNDVVRSEIEIKPCHMLEDTLRDTASTEQRRISTQSTIKNFMDEFGNPIIKPPSYNSVVYYAPAQHTTQGINSTTINNNHHENNLIQSKNDLFEHRSTKIIKNLDQNYDNFQVRAHNQQSSGVSRGQEGIYEQIPAHNPQTFIVKNEQIRTNNADLDYSNQFQRFHSDFQTNDQSNPSDFQSFEQATNTNANKLSDLHNRQFNLSQQGYYFSDGSKRYQAMESRSREARPIELQREELIDEMKETFRGSKRIPEEYLISGAPQAFTPIKPSSQWSENEFSTRSQGGMYLDGNHNQMFAGFRDQELFDEEIEKRQRIDDLEQIEKQRMYIKELHQARHREAKFNVSDRFVNMHETLYENLVQPSRTRVTKYRGKARVIHNFRARKPIELSLRKGEIVFLLRKIDKNWVEGEHHNMSGIFPLSYVEVIESLEDAQATARVREGSATVLFDFHPRSPLELPLREGYVVTLVRKIDDNWYEGRFGNRRGIFPSSYVLPMREPDTPLPTPCVSPMNTAGWRSPSAASIFSMDYPSVCPSELNADFSRVSTPLGGSIMEGYTPGYPTLPRPSSCMPACGPMRSLQGYETLNQRRPSGSADYSWRVRYDGNFDYNTNNNSLNYGHASSQLRQPTFTATTMREDGDRFAPQKHSAHGNTIARMTSLQDYNRNGGNLRYGHQQQGHKVENGYYRNIKVERLDAQNKPLVYPGRSTTVQTPFRNIQVNPIVKTGGSNSHTLQRQSQKTVSLNNEREIDTIVKPIIYPRYKVLHNFEARNPEELSLRQDEVMRVVERCRDGWFIGLEEKSGNFGLFPGNFVELIKSS